MNNFAKDIEEVADDEAIEQIIIGKFGWDNYNNKHPNVTQGELLPWEQARLMLDYEYDTGYGAPDCHAITAWTKSWVLFVVQYDGSTNIHKIPRNPTNHPAEMPGG